MFAKYLNAKKNQEESAAMRAESYRARIAALVSRVHTLKSHLALAERNLAELEARKEATRSIVSPPTFQLLECAAYLARCADLNEVPTCKGGIDKLYQVTGAALSYALADAVYFEWVGTDTEGALYWRDEGLTEECPMVVLAKSREDQRAARGRKPT